MPTAPYPKLSDVMDATRARINDMIVSVGGQTLMNNAPFTLPMVNVAYQRLQQFLVANDYVTLEDEAVFTLPAVSTLDPAVQVSLSWTGYNNGGGLAASPSLPQSLIRPLKLWERPSVNSGTNLNSFVDVDMILGGLDSGPKLSWQQQWEWRADAIYMPGARSNVDLRVKFAKYLPDFTDVNNDVVPIMRSEDALSCFIVVEFGGGRGDVDRATFLAEAQAAAMIIVGGDAARVEKNSERGKMKDRYSGNEAA